MINLLKVVSKISHRKFLVSSGSIMVGSQRKRKYAGHDVELGKPNTINKSEMINFQDGQEISQLKCTHYYLHLTHNGNREHYDSVR